MRALLAAILLVPFQAQSEADKLEAALKKFGDRSYLLLVNGKKVGTLTLKTRIEKEGGRSVAVFEDRFAMTLEGVEMVLAVTEKASTQGLRLISAKRTTKEGGKEVDWTVSVEGTKASLQSGGRKQTLDVTEATIGEQAMVRLVCVAEQKEGVAFAVDVMSGVDDQLQRAHSFRCLGKEQVEIGGKKFDAFKWENKGEWKIVRKVGDEEVPGSTSVNNTFWVSPDGYLLRSTGAGASEFVLDAK